MPTFPGTAIPTGEGSCDRMNHLVDDLMTPRLLPFRQICFFDIPMRLCPDKETWRAPFGQWLEGGSFCNEINFNGCTIETTDPDITDYDADAGTLKITGTEVGADGRPRDVVEATFMFDYFPIEILEGFFNSAIEVINAGAYGPPTDYKICGSAPPNYWDGVMVDLAFAMAMERLLLDYTLWKYRLVFAVGPNDVYEGGGGDVVSNFETLKTNAEERAYRALDNEKFKIGGNYLSPPTAYYFDAIRGFGGSSGAHGIPFSTGRLRGWRPNKWPTG